MPGNFRPEERKASVYSEGWLQNGLCPLRDFIYFHTSLRPLTPVESHRTGRKFPFIPQGLATQFGGKRTAWCCEGLAPGHSRVLEWQLTLELKKRMIPLLPKGHMSCRICAGSPYSVRYFCPLRTKNTLKGSRVPWRSLFHRTFCIEGTSCDAWWNNAYVNQVSCPGFPGYPPSLRQRGIIKCF